jgi:hypothetical protein
MAEIIPGGYNDKNCEKNSAKYHTGKKCIEHNCNNPAGTAWSPYWCVDCNIKRIDNITEQFKAIQRKFVK